MPKNITPQDLKARQDQGETFLVLDVREPWEVQEASVHGALNVPMDDVPASLDKIPHDRPVVVMCHTGSRSSFIADWLETRGYHNVLNLVGGIDRWAWEIDPDIPRY